MLWASLKNILGIRDDRLSFLSESLGGRLHFLHFETRNMMNAISLLNAATITENIRTLGCTGGVTQTCHNLTQNCPNLTGNCTPRVHTSMQNNSLMS